MTNQIGRLSYSSASLLQSCPRKYFLKKVLKVQPDEDIPEDMGAFAYGKVMHGVIELSQHLRSKYHPEMIEEQMRKEGVDPFDANVKYGVAACVHRYYALREKSKLKVVGFEMEIGNEDIIGYVDFVAQDVNGWWYIGDLKSTSMLNRNSFPRLLKDSQLNLYAAFAWQIAEKLKLDMAKFAGCLYCAISKPKMVIKGTERLEEYAARATCDCTEIIIPVALMSPEQALKDILELKTVAENLTEENAMCNHANCFSYFRICEMYSKCHGVGYTETMEGLTVHTDKTAMDYTLPADIEVGI